MDFHLPLPANSNLIQNKVYYFKKFDLAYLEGYWYYGIQSKDTWPCLILH